MERLTKRFTDGGAYCGAIIDVGIKGVNYPTYIGKAVDKLADYEDAEEQGLLHKTKVAIGQTVYTNFAMSGWYLRGKDRPYKAKVVFIGLNDSEEMGGGFFNISYEKLGSMMQFRFSDIGKSVFLTKEEAEKKLTEMGGE